MHEEYRNTEYMPNTYKNTYREVHISAQTKYTYIKKNHIVNIMVAPGHLIFLSKNYF